MQVYRAISALQAELGFTLWFSNYAGARSWNLARHISRQPIWSERREVAPDRLAARELMRSYQRHGAWTWTRYHRWPAAETLYAQPPPDSAAQCHPMAGEWLLDAKRLRYWPFPARRRLQ